MNRRNFLGRLALGPVAGQVAIKNAAARLADTGIAPLPSPAGYAEVAAQSASAPLKLTSFLKYALKREAEWRHRARHVHTLDPDLLSMHLPLTTLVRWQRERNYERIKADEELNFNNVVKQHGHFEF